MKYTQGEWAVRFNGNCSDKNAEWVVEKYNPAVDGKRNAFFSPLPKTGEEGRANAQLKATAPKMLKALKACVVCFKLDSGMEEDFADEIKMAEEIINEAEGK